MKKMIATYYFWLSFVAFVCVYPSLLQAQTEMQIRFVDSATGYALEPDTVLTKNVVTGAVNEYTKTQRTGATGYTPVTLKTGAYEVSVQVAGYQPITARLDAGSAQSLTGGDQPSAETLIFHLDPLQLPPELQAETIRALHRDGALMVFGFIVAATEGAPLAGVVIRSPEKGVSGTSDNTGFFRLYVPTDGQSEAEEFVTLIFEKPGYISEIRQNVALWSQGDAFYQIKLGTGQGEKTFDEKAYREAERIFSEDDARLEATGQKAVGGQSIPATIKVGRSCTTRTNCKSVEVYSLQQYCKHSLASEWIPSWGAAAGGMNSLKAGAVAVRSYAASFVYSPINSRYDICDSTSCQRFDPSRQYSWTNNAVDQTQGYALLYASGGNIVRSEYSAENNNSGCGDGYTGTGSTWPCIADPVCKGKARNGHGRGMCQWGSYRWSIGSGGLKDWQWIVAHYYPNYVLSQVGSGGGCACTPTLQCTLKSGEVLNCKLPAITLAPGFHAQPGSSVTLGQ